MVALLGDGASNVEVAAATARAIENALKNAATDPSLTETVLLLARLPAAARQTEFTGALRGLGVSAGEGSLVDLLAGLERAVDREARMRAGRTDLGVIAQRAAAKALTGILTPELPSLFGTTATDVQAALARLDTPDRFANVSRKFFAELMRHSLEYYLSRAYAQFVGPGEPFRSLSDQLTFREALTRHCYECALIVESYSADWFSKSKHEGGITRQRAAVLARTALSKLRRELSIRAAPDA